MYANLIYKPHKVKYTSAIRSKNQINSPVKRGGGKELGTLKRSDAAPEWWHKQRK